MNNLNDLLDLANSLEWFELETEEQEILSELEASITSIRQVLPSGMVTASIWLRELGGVYVHTICAETVKGIEVMIFDHYKQAVHRLALILNPKEKS